MENQNNAKKAFLAGLKRRKKWKVWKKHLNFLLNLKLKKKTFWKKSGILMNISSVLKNP